MNSYENEIMDLLQGDTPKEKYESLVKLNKENAKHLGTIKFVINQFEAFKRNAPFLSTTMNNWISACYNTLKKDY
jgi:hypothetical protein